MISLNVKLWSNVILVVLIVTIELSIVRKKNRVPSNVTNVGQQINNGFLLFGENNSLDRAGEVSFMA